MKSKDLIRDSSKYFLIKIIRILPPFFMLPILTSYLLPEEYGKFTLILLTVNLFVPIIGLSSQAFLQVNYYKKLSNYKAQFGTALSSSLILSVFLLCLLYLSKDLFTDLTSIENRFIPFIVVLIFLRIIHLINQSHYQVTKNFFLYGFSETSVSLIYLIFGIVFITMFNYSWYYLIYIQIATYFFINCYNLTKLKVINVFDYDFNYKIQKDIIRYGLPLIPHTISIYLFNSIDRFFINHFIGIKETGIYSVSIQLGLAISVMFVSFNTAFVPYLFKQLSEVTKKTAKVLKVIFVILVLTSLISISLYLIFPLIQHLILGEKYQKAIDYMPLVFMTQFFMGGQMIFGNFLFYFERTNLIAFLSLISLIINITLTYFFIPKLGEIGAALSSTISAFVYFSLTIVLSIMQLKRNQLNGI